MCRRIIVDHPRSINHEPTHTANIGWHYICANCGNDVTKKCRATDRKGDYCKVGFCNRSCYDEYRIKDRKANAKPCRNCGNKMDKPSTAKSTEYCSMTCKNEFHIRKCITECKVCGVVFSAIKWRRDKSGLVIGIIKDSTRKVCSPECHHMNYRIDEQRKKKISAAFKGENHPNWMGGTHKMGGRGHHWLAIAESVRDRAGRRCEHCGMSEEENGRRLDVNHIIPFHQHKNKTKANSPSNLEALCRSCHTTADWKYRKDNPMQVCFDIFD